MLCVAAKASNFGRVPPAFANAKDRPWSIDKAAVIAIPSTYKRSFVFLSPFLRSLIRP